MERELGEETVSFYKRSSEGFRYDLNITCISDYIDIRTVRVHLCLYIDKLYYCAYMCI